MDGDISLYRFRESQDALSGLFAGQRLARRNFHKTASALRSAVRLGRSDTRWLFWMAEWLRVYRAEHKWYTQAIVERT